jgi:hypothetical protein
MKKNNTEHSKNSSEKDPYKKENFAKNKEDNTKVESDTSKRPENDRSPLPPNPNKVDNHED